VEVLEFEPGRVFAVRVAEGPESGRRWTIEPDGSGSRVQFQAAFKALRLLAPLARRVIARQFRRYHGNLRRELERPTRGVRLSRLSGAEFVASGTIVRIAVALLPFAQGRRPE
jgi:hypothetical protein